MQQATTWTPPATLAAGLETIGFRVLRQQAVNEPLLFFDTQEGAVFARGGRLVRDLSAKGGRWRFGGRRQQSMIRDSLADLRRAVPWLPGDAELHPVLQAVRCAVRLRLRGLATRDVTVVVERWSFAGTAPSADGQNSGLLVRAALSVPSSAAAGASAVAEMPPFWYVAPDDGPRHDRAYVQMVLDDHGCAVGVRRGQPVSCWDPLTTGLELIGRLAPGLAAPRRLAVRRGDALPTVLGKTIRLQGLRLASCVDGVLCDHHPEYVHDARVAVRRARFALLVAAVNGAPQGRELSDRLRSLARVLGPVRDLDVLLVRLGDLAATVQRAEAVDAGGAGAAEQRLADELWGCREERRATAAAVLQDADTRRLVEQLSGWRADGIADQPAEGSAHDALRAALKRVDKAGNALAACGSVPVRDLHRLRLRLKRLRYTAELFSGALPRRRDNRVLDAVVAECAAAQTLLGDLNDDAIAAAEIVAATGVMRDRGSGDDGAAADLARLIIAVLRQRQDQAAGRFAEGWRRQRNRLRRALKELLG